MNSGESALRAWAAVLYGLFSVAAFGLLVIHHGIVAAWIFGAVACAVPHWLPDNRPRG